MSFKTVLHVLGSRAWSTIGLVSLMCFRPSLHAFPGEAEGNAVLTSLSVSFGERMIWKRIRFPLVYSGSGTDKQFVLPKTSKRRIRSDSRGDEIFQDTSWWMQVNLKPARCVKDLRTPHGVTLTVLLFNSLPPLPLFVCFYSEIWGLPAQQGGGLCQQRPQLQHQAWWDSVCRAGGG